MISRIGLMILVVAASTRICSAADPRFPDWPCAQAKVPDISLAAVWAGPPLDDVGAKWKDDAKVSPLVARLAARRTPLEEADKLNAERSQVMDGLERVMRKQRDAADKIRADTQALNELQDATPPDHAKIE